MRSLLCLVLSIWLSACSLAPKETTIVIYSTNDMHAQIDNFAKVAAYLESERSKHPNTLVLSGGDMFSGNPVVDQHTEKGRPIIELMNRIGYQYAAFGNHEFDYGQVNLQRCMNDADFEMLCANLKVDSAIARFKQPQPYAQLEIDGIQITVLGLIEVSERRTGELQPAAHPARLKGIQFQNPIECALKYKHLRKECDLFLALTHIGHNNDAELANAMPELDAIIGGHSHTRIDSTLSINNVLVNQANAYLNYIGKTTLTLVNKQVKEKTFELIDINQLKNESAEVKEQIQRYYDESPLHQVLAQASQPFQGRHPLGNLMTDAFREIHAFDIAFQNWGGIRIIEHPKGDFTMNDVFRLDPFGNNLMVYHMTPEEIRDLLKNSYQPYSKQIDLIPSGLKYKIHTRDGKVRRITLTDMQGKPLNEKRRYKVGMNNYISSSYRFKHSSPSIELPSTTSDALIEYLKQQKTITPHQAPRGVVVDE